MMSKVFIKDGFYYIIKRDIGESIEQFLERGEYIASQKPKTKEELDKCINQSRVWRNIKFNNCSYTKK